MRRSTLIAFGVALAACGGDVSSTTTTTTDSTPTTAASTTTTTSTTLPPAPTITGIAQLGLGDFSDTPCRGDGGFEDIRGGANVVAKDGDGNTLGVGSLADGQTFFYVDEAENTQVACRFEFEIDLTSEAPFYTVEIAGRGGPTYTQADMDAQDWRVELFLG